DGAAEAGAAGALEGRVAAQWRVGRPLRRVAGARAARRVVSAPAQIPNVRNAAILALVLLAAPSPEPLQISHSGSGAFEASLTPVGTHLVAAWYDTRDGHPEIYLRVLDDRGRPAGPERRITRGAATDFAYEPDVAALQNDLAVAWYERNTATNTYRAQLARVTTDGKVLWLRTLSAAGHDGKNPVVRTSNRDIVVAWLESGADPEPEVRAQWFDERGR